MAVHFRRSFRVAPGVRLNLSIRASRDPNLAAPDSSAPDADELTEQHSPELKTPQSEEPRLELLRAGLFVAALVGIVAVLVVHFWK